MIVIKNKSIVSCLNILMTVDLRTDSEMHYACGAAACTTSAQYYLL